MSRETTIRRPQRQTFEAPTWHEHRGELRTHPERVCGCGGRDIEPTPAMIAQRLRGEL